jgi:NAD kinase
MMNRLATVAIMATAKPSLLTPSDDALKESLNNFFVDALVVTTAAGSSAPASLSANGGLLLSGENYVRLV